MKIFFFIVLVMHSLIHLVGFIKSFNLIELSKLTKPISQSLGVIWLIIAVSLFVCAFLLWMNISWWWVVAIPAVAISQVLITMDWDEAGYGTIANVIILIGALIAFGQWNFSNQMEKKLVQMRSESDSKSLVLESDNIQHLPDIVKRWLTYSEVIGKPIPKKGFLKQEGKLRTTPDGKWMPVTAQQWFNLRDPGFVWKARINAFPGIHISGMDTYLEGKGGMKIKLLSLIPIAEESGEKVDQGSLLRFLGEMAWFPAAATLGPINWEPLDSLSARATMTYGGISASADFHFDQNGQLNSFEAMRYYNRNDSFALEKWHIEAERESIRNFGGIRVPASYNVTWKLEEGDFMWYSFSLTELDYEF